VTFCDPGQRSRFARKAQESRTRTPSCSRYGTEIVESLIGNPATAMLLPASLAAATCFAV